MRLLWLAEASEELATHGVDGAVADMMRKVGE